MDLAIIVSMTISLFLILDPFASLPMFISVTQGLDERTIRTYANNSVLVAAILLLVFLFFGETLMGLFGVTMDTFRVAGGIIFRNKSGLSATYTAFAVLFALYWLVKLALYIAKRYYLH